jgi:Flp pilus assembly protein TadD
VANGHPRYSAAQRAQGILTTVARGDYSLAIARIREVAAVDRPQVMALILKALTREEIAVLRRYGRDLF